MKWVSFSDAGAIRTGVVVGNSVHPYTGSESLIELIGGGTDALAKAGNAAVAGPTVDLADLSIVEPFRPPSMRDSMCFHEHIRNCMGEDIDPRHSLYPTFYISNAAAVIGPFDNVKIAPKSEQYDYELEVAAVIGKVGHNIRPEDAERHIAGYTMYIDWSARDVQFDEMNLRLGPAKGKDTATTLGPYFVTADEFEPLRKNKGFDVGMTVTLNGREVSRGNWSTIDWTFSDVIAYTSRGTTLSPGDVLGSGTVGRGCLFEHFQIKSPAFQGWLQPDDVVEMTVDLIGSTKQTVVAADEHHPLSSGW